MKKLLKIIFIFLIYFLYFFPVKEIHAFEFEKVPENPLPISYLDGYTRQLQTNIFREGELYKGIFTIRRDNETYYSLGYFESSDGLNWQMIKEILNTGSELSNPRLLKTETGYIIFLTKYDNNIIYRIYSSQCDLDFNFSTSFSPVIIPD